MADRVHWTQVPFVNIHLLFGAVLIATVGRCLQGAWRCRLDALHYHLYTRHLARRVYLLLYVLAAVRLSFSVLAGIVNADHSDVLRHLARDESLTDFQIYIGYAFAAILIIRMGGRRIKVELQITRSAWNMSLAGACAL